MDSSYVVLIFVIGTLTLMLFVFTLVLFLIVHKKKRYQHLLEKQQMENNYQNQLLLSRMEVQEQSFKHFSEEIHDNIGQLLSIVKMQLYNIRNSSKEKEIAAKASDCTDLLGKAITDLRNVSHTLNSAYINNAGLTAAVQKDLDYIRSAKDMQCHMHVTGEEYGLGAERELLVFRIIQEAIGNAVKHGSPTAVDVTLNYAADKLNVIIADDGSGFETDGSKEAHGIGLSNMQVRAGMLGGTLEVSSVKNQGTIIELEIKKHTENPHT